VSFTPWTIDPRRSTPDWKIAPIHSQRATAPSTRPDQAEDAAAAIDARGGIKSNEQAVYYVSQTVPGDPAAPDAADPAASVGQSVDNMKKDLNDKKSELEEMRRQAKADLASFEGQQSQLILGKIYQALRDVAVEEQVSVVVDKSSILYGDAAIDLTEKLQQRVRGY
jgi:hypothetical protein